MFSNTEDKGPTWFSAIEGVMSDYIQEQKVNSSTNIIRCFSITPRDGRNLNIATRKLVMETNIMSI